MVAQSPEPGAHVTNARLFNSTMDKDQTTTLGTTHPTLYDKCVGSLTSPANQNNEDAGTGPMVYRPYPRRLEYLTICRCHCKGSIYIIVITNLFVLSRHTCKVGQEFYL